MKKHIHNSKDFKELRKQLRNNATPSELRLWKFLRKSQLEGRKYRRQHSVEYYIFDFYCPAEKLAIELDGSQHDSIVSQQYDNERTDCLRHYGIRMIRF